MLSILISLYRIRGGFICKRYETTADDRHKNSFQNEDIGISSFALSYKIYYLIRGIF